jgi:hypothetical protein
VILGPIVWPAAQIPPEGTWHPCLLAEVRADNDDSAGGLNGGPLSLYPGTCDYGCYFWGNNNICQRNLSYAHLAAIQEGAIELPFVVGSPFNKARLVEVIVHKGGQLEDVPMRLRTEPLKEGADPPRVDEKRVHGAVMDGEHWKLTHPKSGVGFLTEPGQMHRMRLSVELREQLELEHPAIIEIFQRNDGGLITGSVQLKIEPKNRVR